MCNAVCGVNGVCGLLNHFSRNNVLCEYGPIKSGRNVDFIS